MKVTIEFDLANGDMDEERKMRLCMDSEKMNLLLWKFSNNIKHRLASLTEAQAEGYEKAMEDFFRMAEEEKVDLE